MPSSAEGTSHRSSVNLGNAEEGAITFAMVVQNQALNLLHLGPVALFIIIITLSLRRKLLFKSMRGKDGKWQRVRQKVRGKRSQTKESSAKTD